MVGGKLSKIPLANLEVYCQRCEEMYAITGTFDIHIFSKHDNIAVILTLAI